MPDRDPVRRAPRVLAVASGGGHWVQLLRLRPAFEDCEVTYVTVSAAYRTDIPGESLIVVNDATRWQRFQMGVLALRMLWILVRIRPQLVITPGAAPGYLAVRLGRLFGARCVWIDSIANVEEVSMSGRLAARHAQLFLTQWPQLAREEGPEYRGSVL